ncbi:50S ribosomal protein L24 [uncultured Methanoregula sp.]|uniref:50S ribosomal protein L24 n=1 Tax=uncultured Methanoregula sp. TaxID=1005933 RepID=UPI002AAB4E23|nr:50S ribosomal protein L24 [uncultured Methanoregula sp.]
MVRIESSQPRKQRKARYTAPSHVNTKFLNAPLSEALKEKYTKKTLRVIKGDTVKVTRGDFVGNEGLVDAVDTKKSKLVVHGVSSTKADGTEVPRGIDASNVQITKLNLADKRRVEKLGETE